MTHYRWPLLALTPLSLLMLGATPATETEDLVRRAQRALDDQQYERAVELYDLAEARATDPGLVAYNKGVALYQWALEADAKSEEGEKLLARAERHFARCENDPPERRARAAFGRGNCLQLGVDDVSNDFERDIAAMDLAMRLYRTAMRLTEDAELREHARANLNRAKERWLQLYKEKREAPPREPDSKNDGASNRQDDKDDTMDPGTEPRRGDGTQNAEQANGGRKRPNGEQGNRHGQDRKSKKDTSVGEGNLNDRDDERQLPVVPADVARERLRAAVGTILDLRRGARQRKATAESETIKDW